MGEVVHVRKDSNVMIITETWFSEGILILSIVLYRHTLYRCEKKDGVGVGLLVSIPEHQRQKVVMSLSTKHKQAFGDKSIITVYKNQVGSIEKDTYLFNLLIHESNRLLLCADFYAAELDWKCETSQLTGF